MATMDSDPVQKHEYKVRDLATRQVTLFPARAQVVREIKDICLKPGLNEITVIGLTPTVDPQSIKVEGTGSAVISDIDVELLPNRDIFQEIYPDSDTESEPDSAAEESSDDSDNDPFLASDDEDTELDAKFPELKALKGKITQLNDAKKSAKEGLASAETRLRILDAHGKELNRKKDVDITKSLETYRAEREKVFHDHMAGATKVREIDAELDVATKEQKRLSKLRSKEQRKSQKKKQKARNAKSKQKRKAQKAKDKEDLKVSRRKAEAEREKVRVRREREKFWPLQCYTVRVTLDASVFTPEASRRNSISSESAVSLAKKPESLGHASATAAPSGFYCDLSLTYVTTSAFWAPSYDLQLFTTSNSATLSFDAQLTNATSETWSNCKITLSTSQATFLGLADVIPTLGPWHLQLAPKDESPWKNYWTPTDIMKSRQEVQHRDTWLQMQRQIAHQKPRAGLFGPPPADGFINPWHPMAKGNNEGNGGPFRGGAGEGVLFGNSGGPGTKTTAFGAPAFGAAAGARGRAFGAAAPANNPTTGLFGANNNNTTTRGGLFGGAVPSSLGPSLFSSAAPDEPAPQPSRSLAAPPVPPGAAEGAPPAPPAPAPAPVSGGLFGRATAGTTQPPAALGGRRGSHSSYSSSDGAVGDGDDRTFMDPQPELEFQESVIEETGLTTTYDLAGSKTLAPRSTTSKQHVARIALPNIIFSHSVVPKYKPVVYLKARLSNTSKWTLLRGAAGLTLDGSFMGRTTLPRCSPGDTFSLSLGVDPAIKVVYPKPEVHRAQSGLFNKEDSTIYSRSITLVNTRSSSSGGKPATLLVLDQIPVSEDDKLKVQLLQPKGLTPDGESIPAGVSSRKETDGAAWGKALARLKKTGEVGWDVTLNPGKSAKLVLEYGVTLPAHERAMECSGGNASLFGHPQHIATNNGNDNNNDRRVFPADDIPRGKGLFGGTFNKNK